VIVTRIGDQETLVWFDNASHKKYHGDICNDPKEATVTGAVTRAGGKLLVTVKSVKYLD
jgi:hypothetical protein